jgi:hypothetical protein
MRPSSRSSTSPSHSSAPSHSALPVSLPRLRRETRSVASSSIRAASCQEPVEEGAEVGCLAGVATSGPPSPPLLGEGEGEGGETRSVGVAAAERDPSPPPYPQDEAAVPAVAAAAEVEEEDEENADEPPDFFLAAADAETLFRRGVHALELVHNNIDELDQVRGLAGGLRAAVEARRNITLAGAELRQAFTITHQELERVNERRAQLVDQLTDLNERLHRDLHQARIESHRQQDRAHAAHQLRNNLELLLHQARIQNEQQQMELLEAAPEIEQIIAGRQNAIADVRRLEEEIGGLRLQNAQLEEEVAVVGADDAHNVRRADQLHAELHRWHRMAVRLNNERVRQHRYDLPNIGHHDEADDPALQFEAGHEFDEPPPAPQPSPVQEPERAVHHEGQVIAQPEQANQQTNQQADEIDEQERNIANVLLLFRLRAPERDATPAPGPQPARVEEVPAAQNLQPQVGDYSDYVSSDLETLVGENSP